MGDIETAVRYSKEIEGLLEGRYGAVGRGLHEKLSSIESKLPPNFAKKVRHVATIRNKVVHESDFVIKSPLDFAANCDEVIQFLKDQPETGDLTPGGGLSEESFRRFMAEIKRPTIAIMAAMGGLFGLIWIGIGAGVLGIVLAAWGGLYVFSDVGIKALIDAFYWILGLLVFAVFDVIVVGCWNLGHPVQSDPVPSKSSPSASTPLRKKSAAKRPTEPPSSRSASNLMERN